MDFLKYFIVFIAGALISYFIFSFKKTTNVPDTAATTVVVPEENDSISLEFNAELAKPEFEIIDKKKFDEKFEYYKERVDLYSGYRNFGARNKKRLLQVMYFKYDYLIENLKKFKEKGGADGVRIYLYMHGADDLVSTEETRQRGEDRKKIGVNALDVFFVGTKLNNKDNYIYDLVDNPKDTIKKASYNFYVFGSTYAFNEGTLCPPPNKDCNVPGVAFLQ